MSVLYVEGFSGLSGDMFLSALAGLADAYETLKELPDRLNLPEASVEISSVTKNGIVCNLVQIIEQKTEPKNVHGRHLSHINQIIEKADIEDEAKKIAKEIFLIIGKAESKIHNIPLEKIHFHEISAVDSILDIVGSAVLLAKLGITKTYSTAICSGYGFVQIQHGKLPVPAPATKEILSGIPYYTGDEKGERITPTGAAILKYLNPEFDIQEIVTEKTAYGPGTKDFITPNVLRLSLLKEDFNPEKLFVLETNLDDITGEWLGNDFQNGLLNSGAIDFFLNPVQMKKARPGILLSCLVAEQKLDELSDFILENTTTIGVRYYPVERKTLSRQVNHLETKYGKVRVKTVVTPSGKKRSSFEYADLQKISSEKGISIVMLQQELNSLINLSS